MLLHYPTDTEIVSIDVLDTPLPPLLKANLRLVAKACGEPCRDTDFGVADIFMLLRVSQLNPAYSRHFIDRAGVH